MKLARLEPQTRPHPKLTRKRLAMLVDYYGTEDTAALLSCSRKTIYNYSRGFWVHPLRYRWIWLLWAVTFAPHETKTLFDLATWGRFATPPPGWKLVKPKRRRRRKRASSKPVSKEKPTPPARRPPKSPPPRLSRAQPPAAHRSASFPARPPALGLRLVASGAQPTAGPGRGRRHGRKEGDKTQAPRVVS